MPKRGELEFPSRITAYLMEMLDIEDDHALEIVPYPYVSLRWRGCPKILFTLDEPSAERGNINVMFKLL